MEPQTLETTWYALLGAVWVLYLVLGGVDLGIGQLVRRVDRSAALRTIGPTWAANDVWLVIAIAVTLGAFPGWYAELLSGAYLPFVVLVSAVMLRHAGMELVGHATPPAQRRWAHVIVIASHVVPFVLGLLWAGAIDGSLAAGGGAGLGLVTPTGALVGLALTALCRLQGLAYLRVRAPEGSAGLPARATAMVALALTGVASIALTVAAVPGLTLGPIGVAFGVLAVAGLASAIAGALRGHDVLTLLGAAAGTAGTAGTVLALLHTTPIAGPGPHGVTLASVASGPTTLGAMLVITVVLLPVLLATLAYAYVRFLTPPPDAPARGPRSLLARAARGTLNELR